MVHLASHRLPFRAWVSPLSLHFSFLTGLGGGGGAVHTREKAIDRELTQLELLAGPDEKRRKERLILTLVEAANDMLYCPSSQEMHFFHSKITEKTLINEYISTVCTVYLSKCVIYYLTGAFTQNDKSRSR